jgi:hypothetical protein
MNINDLKIGDNLAIKNACVGLYTGKIGACEASFIRNPSSRSSFSVSYVSVDYIIESTSFLFGLILLNAEIDKIVTRNEYK